MVVDEVLFCTISFCNMVPCFPHFVSICKPTMPSLMSASYILELSSELSPTPNNSVWENIHFKISKFWELVCMWFSKCFCRPMPRFDGFSSKWSVFVFRPDSSFGGRSSFSLLAILHFFIGLFQFLFHYVKRICLKNNALLSGDFSFLQNIIKMGNKRPSMLHLHCYPY